jgi:Ca2+-binding RTX toxin-like protein
MQGRIGGLLCVGTLLLAGEVFDEAHLAASAQPVAAVALAGTSGSASAASLAASASARFHGPLAGAAGSSVAAAGDFNGDGIDDVVIGAPDVDGRGEAFVVFGRRGLGAVDLGRLGPRGVRILGEAPSDGAAGASVAGVGDVNGDGLDDVVVTDAGALAVVRPGRRGVDRSVAGFAYVVYGRRSQGTVKLRRLGTGGFAIRGVEDGTAAGAGDVNGDGFADVVVAAGDRSDGGAYVVFGAPRRRSFDAARIGGRGFTIRGRRGDGQAGPVAGAGDVNGDGLGDVVVGAPISLGAPPPPDAYEPFGGGAAYVVFGQRSNAAVRMGDRGFRIAPPPGQIGAVGAAVGGAGDVNGDGFADVIVGAPVLPIDFRAERVGPGSAFVVFGAPAPDTVTLGEALRPRGFEIRGARPARGIGTAVAGIGDHNGDGLGDVLIGAPHETDAQGSGAPPGAALLVYGRVAPGRIELAAAVGLTLEGLPGDRAGSAVAAVGDPNADGRPDLLIGAPESCPAVWRDGPHLFDRPSGVAYLVTPNAPASPLMTGGPGRDLLVGDVLRAAEGDDCLYGLAGPDRLFSGPGSDSLLASGGSDVLDGGGGDDLADGGPGDDRITGGASRDRLNGRAGADRIDGGPGADSLDGAAGSDRLLGEGGKDDLQGETGRDELAGGPGRDVLYGGPGGDRLTGGSGPDYIVGEGGPDRLRGGPGDDVILSRDRRRDRVLCGPGTDRVRADPGDRLRGCERGLRARALR